MPTLSSKPNSDILNSKLIQYRRWHCVTLLLAMLYMHSAALHIRVNIYGLSLSSELHIWPLVCTFLIKKIKVHPAWYQSWCIPPISTRCLGNMSGKVSWKGQKKKKNKHSVPPIHVCICVGLEHVICSVVFMYALNRNLTSRLYNNKKKSLFMTCVHVTSFCILLKLKHISH